MTKRFVERRKNKRFRVAGGAFVGVGPGFGKVGPIKDISMGGLRFRYMDTGERSRESYLNIFLVSANFYFDKVPFETISDFETQYIPFGSLGMRQCGVQFGKLTHQQKADLEQFICNHTDGEI